MGSYNIPAMGSYNIPASEWIIDGSVGLKGFCKAFGEGLNPFLGACTVGVTKADGGPRFSGVGPDRRTLGRHRVAVDTELDFFWDSTQFLMIRTIILFEQGFDHVFRRKIAIDGNIPARMGFYDPIFPAIILGPVQIDDRPCHLCGCECRHLLFKRPIYFGGSAVPIILTSGGTSNPA
jgi:hypothetical protein